MAIDYATAYGFHSVVAAVVFAILYVPLLGFFVLYGIRNPTYVLFTLCLFCTLRIAAFTIRALLAHSESLGTNENLLITDEVLFGIGFFGLLYSAYTLVLDRIELNNISLPENIISRFTQNRRLFRVTLTIGIVLGVMGITKETSDNASSRSTGNTLHKASTIIFLVLTILQTYQTVLFTANHRSGGYKNVTEKLGQRHASLILCLVAVLLIVREAFMTATISNATRQNDEKFWYPLIAVPEILAVVLYAVPGLVPGRAELQAGK